ncbi:sensor histidine kinase [Flavobacterium sp.]|jgi:PAS domain S-box-containing protein|uniref:sensor histidine kinase n=1 Tax=Flavobacterium sp. TaxID=239 RepID=UPI0022C4A047|nr:PAS domain-containing protein [Flavobacterium sp.]MCZ8145092.1 PAS domain S-box protein [Flavobacterium sp.]MCZ8366911.1 PAS domain S-box protein [Flavobacterium sp.]
MKHTNLRFFLPVFLTLFALIFAGMVVVSQWDNPTWQLGIGLGLALGIALFTTYFLAQKIGTTERYMAQFESEFSELSVSNERFEIVSKATSDTIWDWDVKTNSFIWNKGIQGVFGYKKDQVGDNLQWWFDKIHPEDSLKISVKLYSYIAQRSDKWQDEYRFMDANGQYRYVYDRGFLVKDEEGNVVRMIGAMQDVTRQKEEEQRLRLLETVIIQNRDTVLITAVGASENAEDQIVYVNPAFEKMTGYDQAEVLHQSATFFFKRIQNKRDVKKIADALKKKEAFTLETLTKRKDNTNYWVNLSLIPITNHENQHTHWISIQRDITEEKEQEKEREQLIKELTQNNSDLKQFSYITSHNLRAPLSNLTGLLNLLEDIEIEDYELKEILQGFSKSTQQLNDTVNDLVNIIIIKDSLAIDKEPIVIRDVFENIFNQLSFLISNLNPIIKLDVDKVNTLFLNRSYFESILLNLTTNALRYSDPSRQLKILVAAKNLGTETQITFKDNGLGIDLKRHRDKVFGLYQRFHDNPDSKGLGLYLVKSQVESMGGSITIDSEVGVGTTFTITFKNS